MHRRYVSGGLAAIALALGSAGVVSAYAGQVAGSVEITVGDVTCKQPISVTATVLDQEGRVIAGQEVAWAFTATPSSADTIIPSSSTTNVNGVATTTVTLACVPGNRHLRATADQVSGTAVFGLTEGQVLGVTGLPNTTTARPSVTSESGSMPVLLAATALLLALVLVGGGLKLRGRLSARR
jgi:hypothetical protein